MFADLFGNMAPETSTYQAFKIWLGGYIPIDRDVLHIILGGIILAVAALVQGWRRGARTALALSFGLALVMEALDRRDDIAVLGAWRWGESLADVVRTILIPLVAVALLALLPHRPRSEPPE